MTVATPDDRDHMHVLALTTAWRPDGVVAAVPGPRHPEDWFVKLAHPKHSAVSVTAGTLNMPIGSAGSVLSSGGSGEHARAAVKQNLEQHVKRRNFRLQWRVHVKGFFLQAIMVHLMHRAYLAARWWPHRRPGSCCDVHVCHACHIFTKAVLFLLQGGGLSQHRHRMALRISYVTSWWPRQARRRRLRRNGWSGRGGWSRSGASLAAVQVVFKLDAKFRVP